MAQGAARRETRLTEMAKVGQSVWYDNIRRGLIRSGDLARLVEQGVRGLTSNPTIFEKAIDGSDDYDEPILAVGPEASLETLYDQLVQGDIQAAADTLRPVYDESGGADGFVSVEVFPYLAHDAEGTVREALRLRALMDRPNVMIKVPATPEGCEAIERLTGEGVSVNVTLIFSLGQYARVMEAYLKGLEQRVRDGRAVDGIASVASFFVSRVDTAVDRELTALADRDPNKADSARALLGKIAVANTKLAYEQFRRTFESERFRPLAEKGARPQRPLWASTSTKNPAYPDLLYVDPLIGPNTVNTMPDETVRATLDHAKVANRIGEGLEEARREIASLAGLGVDLDAVTERLQADGLKSFSDSFDKLMTGLSHKRARLFGGVPTLEARLGGEAETVEAALRELDGKRAGLRLFAKDGSLWSDDPEAIRFIPTALGWLDAPAQAAEDLGRYEKLAERAYEDGDRDAVVLGMGGSSLCPHVLSQTFAQGAKGMHLHVLDSTHPDAVLGLERAIDPAHTLFLVSSKSGSTTEPNAFYRYFRGVVEKARGAREAGRAFVAITDPGTSLERLAKEDGFRDILPGPPDVGGRYSALTAFGLGPACLLGMDTAGLVSRARRMLSASSGSLPTAESAGAYLGAILGALGRKGRNKVTLVTEGGIESFSDWLEQLLAESTGKLGRGLVPVAHEPFVESDRYGADRIFVWTGVGRPSEPCERHLNALEAAGQPVVRISLAETLDLGGEFVRWEVATAIASVLLHVNGFDQPNVQESKDVTASLVKDVQGGKRLSAAPGKTVTDGGVQVTSEGSAPSVEAALAEHLRQAHPGDYVAFMAYADPDREFIEEAMAQARSAIVDHLHVATTFGYGPRFLHSTGQLHKGGPDQGLFIQITQRSREDADIPGLGIPFGTLVEAQALGDLMTLRRHERPTLRVTLDPGADVWRDLARHLTQAARAAAHAPVKA